MPFKPRPGIADSFELKVSLRHVEPDVWRTLRFPAALSLDYLHAVLQIAFGWDDSHLHHFMIGDITIGPPEEGVEALTIDEAAVPLGAVARKGTKILYHYDFGDDWQHDIVVQSIVRDSLEPFACLGGACASPPEDCGGPHRYTDLLTTLASSKKAPDEDDEELEGWLGPHFDPAKFDRATVDKNLSTLWKAICIDSAARRRRATT